MPNKPAKDLQIGDKVKLDSGKVVTVTSMGPGMYKGSTLIHWKGSAKDNWGHVHLYDTIETV
jgi:hypothetical protein